jgi:HSP20 family protein
MSVIRWDPFGDVGTVFNRMMSGNFWPRLSIEGKGEGGGMQWSPSADISETEKEYLIRAELPAVKKEDIQVTLDNGVITIKGERRQQQEDKNEKFHRVENFYGSFERSFSIPDNVKPDAISCDSKDGVLSVHIPKAEVSEQKPQQIAVR